MRCVLLLTFFLLLVFFFIFFLEERVLDDRYFDVTTSGSVLVTMTIIALWQRKKCFI